MPTPTTGSASPDRGADWAALARAARAGDPAAWEALVARCAPLVRRQARRYGWPGATREDLEQEAWLGLVRAVRTFDPARGADFRRFAAYAIRRQLQTACKQAFRHKHRAFLTALRLEQSLGDDPDATLGDRIAGPPAWQPEAPWEPDPLAIARAAVAAAPLTRRERQAVQAWAAGLPYDAIAARLGRPRKAVDNAVQRALRKIRAAAGADRPPRIRPRR